MPPIEAMLLYLAASIVLGLGMALSRKKQIPMEVGEYTIMGAFVALGVGMMLYAS